MDEHLFRSENGLPASVGEVQLPANSRTSPRAACGLAGLSVLLKVHSEDYLPPHWAG